MKTLKKILIAIVVLVALLAIIGLFLPSTYRVERSLVMKATPEKVFPWFNSLKKWPEWCAWNVERDPTLKYQYSGPDSGVGAGEEWTAEKLGNGKLIIRAIEPPKRLEYDLSFDQDKFKSKGTIVLEAVPEGTRVVWSDTGDLGVNPVSRWFGLMMNSMIGPDFEAGLAKLKTKVEEKAP